MKKIIFLVALVILFYQTTFAQILRPFPEPEISNLTVHNFGVSGVSFLKDSSGLIYFGWVDSVYDAYPANIVKLPDESVMFVIELDSINQKEEIMRFIEMKSSEGVPLSKIVSRVKIVYDWGLVYKTEWTKYLHIF